jgi:hypothetical protein
MSERETDQLLDAAIDVVAKELTAGEPRSGFASRVQSRLEKHGWWSPSPWHPHTWRWVGGAAAVALLLVAVGLFPAWDAPRLRENAVYLPATSAVPPDTVAAAPAVPRGFVPTPHGSQVSARRSPRATREMLRVAIDPDAPQIAALARIDALGLEPLDVPELTIPPLDPNKEPR